MCGKKLNGNPLFCKSIKNISLKNVRRKILLMIHNVLSGSHGYFLKSRFSIPDVHDVKYLFKNFRPSRL